MQYDSLEELVKAAQAADTNISDIIIDDQMQELQVTASELMKQMELRFDTMCRAVKKAHEPDETRRPLLCENDALTFSSAVGGGKSIGGEVIDGLIANALAVSTQNARMGKIVAAPTAGSCGIIPSVLITAMKLWGLPRQKIVASLFTAGGVGMIIAGRATLSGAEGGCQAECGSATAMAAAALAELAGGTPQMCADACAIALKSIMGLVCDPVAGLVEVPCIKRNAMGAVEAWTAADMALAGIKSVIPADEVIDAMKAVGEQLPAALRETAEGGLAATPTGKELAKRLAAQK